MRGWRRCSSCLTRCSGTAADASYASRTMSALASFELARHCYCSGPLRAFGIGSGITAMPSSSSDSVSSRDAWPRMPRSSDFAVVDLARLFGETLAHVFGVRHHLAHQLQPGGLQLRVGRGHHLLLPAPAAAGAAAPRFRRGALGSLATAASPHSGHSTSPRASWSWNVSSEREPAFEAVAVAALEVEDLHGALSPRLRRLPVEFPCARQHVLQPQGAGQGLGVGHRAVAAPAQAAPRGVAVKTSRNSPWSSCARRSVEAAREPDVDDLVGIRHRRVHARRHRPTRAPCSRFPPAARAGRRPAALRPHRACRPGTRSSPGRRDGGTGAPAPRGRRPAAAPPPRRPDAARIRASRVRAVGQAHRVAHARAGNCP